MNREAKIADVPTSKLIDSVVFIGSIHHLMFVSIGYYIMRVIAFIRRISPPSNPTFDNTDKGTKKIIEMARSAKDEKQKTWRLLQDQCIFCGSDIHDENHEYYGEIAGYEKSWIRCPSGRMKYISS